MAKGAGKKGRATEEEAEANTSAVRNRISGATDLGALADCDLIIEAIVEDYEVKNPLFAELGNLCKDETIFASNTSSLSITKMADASGRPTQFCGLHYFNPVQVQRRGGQENRTDSGWMGGYAGVCVCVCVCVVRVYVLIYME